MRVVRGALLPHLLDSSDSDIVLLKQDSRDAHTLLSVRQEEIVLFDQSHPNLPLIGTP